MPQSASDRKRIALVIHALHGGGAERLMSQLAARWSHNHDVHLITWSKIETDKYTVPKYVTRHGLDLMRPSSNAIQGIFANFKRVRELRRCLSKISPDFVLSFSDQTNIVTLQATSKLSRAANSSLDLRIQRSSQTTFKSPLGSMAQSRLPSCHRLRRTYERNRQLF